VTSAFLYPIAVSVSSITAFMGPLMIRNSERLIGSLGGVAPRPLVTYLSLYGRLVAELKTLGKKAFMNEETEPLLVKLATNLLVVMAVLVTGRVGVEFAEREEALAGLVNAIWVMVGILLLPFLYTSLRLWDAFLGALIGQAVARHHGRQAERVGTVLKNSLRLLTVLLLGSLVLAVGSPFLPPLSVASIVFASVGMAALRLWVSIQEAHRGIEGIVLRIFEKELPEEMIVRAAMADTIRREYPWGGDFEAMSIREASPAAGKALKDLDVRGKTGAMVVYLRRSGEHLVNPPPSTILHPGDVAILIGDEEQLNRAKSLLLIP
ncbi:MAG: TrkA C-terminal domain-containing protein, partial [Candidatus Hydrothermarchaeota archaeon]